MVAPAVVLLIGTALGISLITVGLFHRRIQTPYRLGLIAGGLFALGVTIFAVMAFGIITAPMAVVPYFCMLMGLLQIWLELFVMVRTKLWPVRLFRKSVEPRGGMQRYNNAERLKVISAGVMFLMFGVLLLVVSITNLLNYGQLTLPND